MENVNIDPISAVSELEKDIMEVCEKHGFHYVGHSEIRIDKRYNCMRDYGMSVGFKVVKML
jgi:hypothetical protein